MSPGSAPERRRGDRRRADKQRFWRAQQGAERRVGERRRAAAPGTNTPERLDGEGVPDRPGPSSATDGPDPDAARRATLRRLLRAAEARRERSSPTRRRPALGPGVRVRVLRGELAGHLATVADADFIHSRVLLDPDGDAPSRWVPFGRVGTV